jgi:UV DNA damage endonuclease
MSLGLCCQWLESRTKRDGTVVYENMIDEKSLQLGAYRDGKYSRERIIDTYRNNVNEHLRILPKIIEGGIKSFRLSSSLFPLFEFCSELARNDQQLLQGLATLGESFKSAGIRVTTHPGQFTVLSSDKQDVVDNSIRELEYHAWVFDQMGLDQTAFYAINIHGGKANRKEQLINVIQSLPPNVKNRLTLENDEKCYNVPVLCDISSVTNIPVVFDSHHYNFNTGDLSFDVAYNMSRDTWGNIKPLQHLSNTEPGMEEAAFNQKRAHSQMIHYVPDLQLEAIRANTIDVDVEAKGKNLAIFQMRKDFNVEA